LRSLKSVKRFKVIIFHQNRTIDGTIEGKERVENVKNIGNMEKIIWKS